jgi:hypothetical protein
MINDIRIFLDDDGYPKGSVDFINASLDKIKAVYENIVSEQMMVGVVLPGSEKEITFVITNDTILTPSDYDYGFLSYSYDLTKKDGEVFFNIKDLKKGNLTISASKRNAPLCDSLTHYLIFSGSLDKFDDFAIKNRIVS